MADNQKDLDAILQEEDQTLPPDSQTDSQNDGSNADGQLNGAAGQTPEEVEFNSLSGPARERFREVLKERNEYRDKARDLESSSRTYAPPPPPPGGDNPDVREAVKKLSDVGIATKDDIDRAINNTVARIQYFGELTRLEKDYDGADGRPAFVREEYQDYIDKHPQYKDYLPEDVYKKMFDSELTDFLLKNKGQVARQGSSSLRPTRTNVRESELTPEEINTRLSQPDGREWYEKNQEKINKALQRMSS